MTDNELKWHLRFLNLVDHVAQWSKDPSSKVGCVLIRPDRTIASVGFNGFARDMSDRQELYNNREIKLSRVIHAEMNCVLNAREPVKGYSLYTSFPSCNRCSVHMIQAGIRKFVCWSPTPEQSARWDFSESIANFKEVGAEYIQIERNINVIK